MQAWARLIRKRGFNMAGKENQWDLRVEYGWGRCARTRTNTQAHTYRLTQSGAHAFHTHTLGKTHARARSQTHAHTHKSSPSSSHWHMPRQLFTVTSNYICKKAPQDTTSL